MVTIFVEIFIEATQIYIKRSKYFEFYNLFDLGIIILHIIFLTFHYLEDEAANEILTVVTFGGVFRGIATIFR